MHVFLWTARAGPQGLQAIHRLLLAVGMPHSLASFGWREGLERLVVAIEFIDWDVRELGGRAHLFMDGTQFLDERHRLVAELEANHGSGALHQLGEWRSLDPEL